MGAKLSKTRSAVGSLFSSQKVNVLVVGIDGAGKSTIINQLKAPYCRSTEVVPTVGCHIDEVRHGAVTLTAFDMAGGSRYRSMWQNYYKDAEGIIYVIDSADQLRLAVSGEELEEMLAHPDIKARAVPILFLASKMDLPGSLPPQQISEALGLGTIRGHAWQIAHCNGLTGDGVADGLDWLVQQLVKHKAQV